MNAQVIIGGNDISSYILSISRSKNYCEISQTFNIELPLSYTTTIDTYDDITIYEEGVKVLTGYVSSVVKNAIEGNIVVSGQDVYKKANDFFVDSEITTTEIKTSRYWIEYFLSLAGLTATFTSGDGPLVPEDSVFGLAHVSEIIEDLVHNAAWYGHVDADGNLFFGKLVPSPSGKAISDGINLLDFGTQLSYDKTRNVAHVHGGVELTLDGFEAIFAKSSVNVPYLPNDQIVVASNHLIGTRSAAQKFANELVATLSNPTFVKEALILGDPEILAGTYIYVYTDLYTGHALITNLSSTFDSDGYRMALTLDDLCPRLIAQIAGQNELYAGTDGAGVWAWGVYSPGWVDISNGMTDLHVIDLSVDRGLLTASTPTGVFVKINNQPWELQTLPTPTASGFVPASGIYTYPAVYSNSFDRQVSAVVNFSGGSGYYSWLYTGEIDSNLNVLWESTSLNDELQKPYLRSTDMEGTFGTRYIVAKGAPALAPFTATEPITTDYDTEYHPALSHPGFVPYVTPFIKSHELKTYSMNGITELGMFSYDDSSVFPAGTSPHPILFTDEDYAYSVSSILQGPIGNRIYTHYLVKFDAVTGEYVSHVEMDTMSGQVKVVGTNIDLNSFGFGGSNIFLSGDNGYVYYSMGSNIKVLNYKNMTSPTVLYTETAGLRGLAPGNDGNVWALFGYPDGYKVVKLGDSIEEITVPIGDYVDLSEAPPGEDYEHTFTFSNDYFFNTRNNIIYFNVQVRAKKHWGNTPSDPPDETRYTAFIYFKLSYGSITGQVTISYDPDNTALLVVDPLGTTGNYGWILTYNQIRNTYNGNVIVEVDPDWELDFFAADIYRLYMLDKDFRLFELDTNSGDFKLIDNINGLPATFTETMLLTQDQDTNIIYAYRRNQNYTLDHIFSYDTNITPTYYLGLYGNDTRPMFNFGYLIYGRSAIYLEEEIDPGTQVTYLIEAYPEESPLIIASGIGFREVNPDNLSKLSVYGEVGLFESADFFLTFDQPILDQVYDAAGKLEVLYATTTPGIYNDEGTLINEVSATEIVAREYDGAEVFFSVGGEVKMSTNELSSYTDISTGLPGETVTVLRLGEST